MRKLLALMLLLLVASCASVGPSDNCGAGDGATYLTVEQQDALTDDQVRQILGRNDAQVVRGCAIPNKG